MSTPQPKPKPPIQIRPAIPSDLPSLTTIVPRAFHPRNAYIKKCHPDTPAVRAWWWKIFAEEIAEPDCYVLVAAIGDDDGNLLEGGGGEREGKGMEGGGEGKENVVGVLCLRLMPAITSSSSPSSSSSSSNNQNENEEKEKQNQNQKDSPLLPCGFWTKYPLTPDQNSTLFQPAITAMSQARALAFSSPSPSKPTPNQAAPQPHFLLELLGISHDYQNLQLARRLLTLAGEISDKAGWETFVEANANAVGLYRKMGFEEVGKVEIPWVEDDDEDDDDEEHGGDGDGDGEGEHEKKKEGKEVKMYVEHMLIRPVGGGTTRG